MTDPGFADRTYIEPLDLEGVASVLRRERPDALLPTLGGQTALNLAVAARRGGHPRRARRRADRRAGRGDPPRRGPRALPRRGALCGLEVPASTDRHLARRARRACRCPAVVRPAFTLGGHGGGFADDRADAPRIRSSAASGSRPIGQVLVEESVRGWDEFELEVMRDRADNVVIVCSIENLDPMGVHTGDSVTVAPQMTLSDEAYQELRDAAARDHPRRRRRDGRLEHPVRARPRDRRAARDRDEPARLALVGARLEGDRLPDREGRRQARRRLHARRDPERPDEDDAGELRADARLRRRQVPALRVREVPGRRPDPRHADEVRRRGDGHRPHVLGGAAEGPRVARAREGRADAVGERSTTRLPDGPASRGSGRRSPVPRGSSHSGDIARAKRAGWGDDTLGEALGRSGAGGAPRCAASRASGRRSAASTRAPARSRPPPTTTTRPGARRTRRRRRATSRASSSSARARTGSARASSSTTAACTPRRRSARSATRR